MSLFRTKAIAHDIEADTGLKRSLNAFDLTMLGIGAIIGAGIFVLTGVAAATHAGPAIVLSYVLAGTACACAALSYAELAASVGGAGSAYGYGYAGLGELPAWIIGWMLVLEYTVSVAAVSAGWSGYFNSGLLEFFGSGLPDYLLHAPGDAAHPGGLVNLPAATIIALLGVLLATGAKSSAQFNSVMVAVKLTAIAIFIAVASFHVNPANWQPFVPPEEVVPGGVNGFSWDMSLLDYFKMLLGFHSQGEVRYGWSGIASGAATIFFAYLGFDAVSTAAEETRKPQRDLPIGILASLALCTILYIIVSGLLTGIVSYKALNVAHPVAFALEQVGAHTAAGLISIGAIAGLTTVMLVMFFGQSRVLFAISRDGLLPKFFATIHPKTRTPFGSIVLSGIVMLILGGFVPLGKLVEVANIGTLGAFVIVSFGVIVLRRSRPELKRPFRTPLFPLVPIVGALACFYLTLNLSVFTWAAFLVWLVAGQLIYFNYSRSHSELAQQN
ncbi:MAG: amino acid permease [Nevskia sp.]|nr:amino acid permease [Nevskia sp.]